MAKVKKTNAMRILDGKKIDYQIYEYDASNPQMSGLTVAEANGLDPNIVFKTLVTIGNTKNHYVFVIPVNKELNLKKAAKVTGEKRVEMIPQKDLLVTTGYIHGGCSPVGMKKLFKTFIHSTALDYDSMICSSGKRGLQIHVKISDLLDVVGAEIADLCND